MSIFQIVLILVFSFLTLAGSLYFAYLTHKETAHSIEYLSSRFYKPFYKYSHIAALPLAFCFFVLANFSISQMCIPILEYFGC